MFTGLVEQVSTVVALQRTGDAARLQLNVTQVGEPIEVGESIAVNGCCLTVAREERGELTFDLLAETLARTNLGRLAGGSLVNLERALGATARLGGHFVQGHIDCTAAVQSFEKRGADYRLEIELPQAFARYLVSKGSVAVNGISLTVAEVSDNTFVVWIIPHTFERTNLRSATTGDFVNLEFDILAKYVERIVNRTRLDS